MVLKLFSTTLKKLENLVDYSSGKHKLLVQILESLDMETLKVNPIQDQPTKVAVEISVLEDIASSLCDLHTQDFRIRSEVRKIRSRSNLAGDPLKVIGELKENFNIIKQNYTTSLAKIQDNMKQLSKVLKAYRERCRETLVDYLKSLDLELRKILKPLVPSRVLEENVKYPKINLNPSLLSSAMSSLSSTFQDEPAPKQRRHPSHKELKSESSFASEGENSNVDKLQSHIQMLVGTLETIAKDLILVLDNSNRKYFEVVNPRYLSSSPPTPLATPLPEYFVFDIEDSQANTSAASNKIDAEARIALSARIRKLKVEGRLSSNKAEKMLNRIEGYSENEEITLEEFFKTVDVSGQEKESIVFNLLHTGKVADKDVSILDMVEEEHKAPLTERTRRMLPKHTVSEPRLPRKISNNEIKEKIRIGDISQESLGSPVLSTERSKENPRLKEPQLKRSEEFFGKHRRSVPISAKNPDPAPPTLNAVKSAVKLSVARTPKEVRVRSITPIKNKSKGSRSPHRKSKSPLTSRRNGARSPVF
jgi:hypothetical protein